MLIHNLECCQVTAVIEHLYSRLREIKREPKPDPNIREFAWGLGITQKICDEARDSWLNIPRKYHDDISRAP